jgi:hypothetical protein
MATTYYNEIQKLYVAYFNRPGDPTGLAFWEKAVEASNGSTAIVAAEFAKQIEYTDAFKGMTNAEIVDQVYMNLFGRSSAGDNGADFWVKGLDNKVISVADVVTAVAAGAQLSDKTAFNNKVAAAASFSAALDTDAEVAGYAGVEANKVAKAWLTSITTDVSFAAATTPAALNTTVATAVAAGTPFTVSGALASMDAAQTAVDNFVATIDTDGDGKTSDTLATDIEPAYTAAVAAVAAKLDATSATLFTSTSSEVVRDALVSAQNASLSATLSAKQDLLSSANTAVSKVAGLSTAISTLTAATAVEAAANKTLIAANADLAAKEVSFEVSNVGTLVSTTDATTHVTTLTLDYTDAAATDVVLATISASGKATLKSGVTIAGAADLVASINAQATASAAVDKAHTTTVAAQAEVNHLDIDKVTVDATTSKTEAALLSDVTAAINTYATAHSDQLDKVATGSTASEAQITTALKVMETNSTTDFTSFDALVGNYHRVAASNPLVAEQTLETGAVKTANTAITDLAKLVAKMDVAAHNVEVLSGLEATLTAAQDLLDAKGFHLADLATATVGTSASDIFTIASLNTGDTVNVDLFNLLGTDSVFIGSGYKLVQGSIDDVKGDNAALEVFISTNATGDAVLEIETSTFGSSVTNAPEVITITLAGVDATTLHLNNGIISAGTIA